MHKHLNIIPANPPSQQTGIYVEFVFISGHSLRNTKEGLVGWRIDHGRAQWQALAGYFFPRWPYCVAAVATQFPNVFGAHFYPQRLIGRVLLGNATKSAQRCRCEAREVRNISL